MTKGFFMQIDPRVVAPIPVTAMHTMTYTPSVLEFEKIRDRALHENIEILKGIDAEFAAAQAAGSPTDGIAERGAALRGMIAGIRDRCARDMARYGTAPLFEIKVPTTLERETLNSRLIKLGLTGVTVEETRASLIEACYDNFPEAEAEDRAIFLDSLWQREEIQRRAYELWREQETERLLDKHAGAPVGDPAAEPPRMITVREEAQARLLIDALMKTERMRDLSARKLDFDRQNALISVRLHVRAAKGFDIVPQIDPVSDALTEDSAQAIRNEFDRRYGPKLGTQAWLDLVGHIDKLYRLDGFEEKNFDSPLENAPDQTGSRAPSGDIAISDGNSKTSPSEAAPGEESAKTIEPSSGYTSASAGQTSNSFPTDEVLSSSH